MIRFSSSRNSIQWERAGWGGGEVGWADDGLACWLFGWLDKGWSVLVFLLRIPAGGAKAYKHVNLWWLWWLWLWLWLGV